MNPELARLLNVLAHEIRSPLAVSQGYLKLMAEGRLPAPAEQASALERTRDALGKIAALCGDMGRVGALAEAEVPVLRGRMPMARLATAIGEALSNAAPVWRGAAVPGHTVATDGTPDLADAVAALGKLAFADAGPAPKVVDVAAVSDTSLTLLLGGDAAVAAMPRRPDAPNAAAVPLVRGGFGLSLFWATLVLERHRVQSWQDPDGPGAIGFVFSLVNE